jgi:hypothetical protein
MEPTFEERYNELAQIVTNTTWSANERIMYATLRIQAHHRPAQQTHLGTYALFDDLTEDRAAGLADLRQHRVPDSTYRSADLENMIIVAARATRGLAEPTATNLILAVSWAVIHAAQHPSFRGHQ